MDLFRELPKQSVWRKTEAVRRNRKARSVDSATARQTHAAGVAARRARREIYVNPHVGQKALIWRNGWQGRPAVQAPDRAVEWPGGG